MAELRAYDPSWRDRLALLLAGDGRMSATKRAVMEGLLGSTGLGSTGSSLSDFTPAGMVFAADEAARAASAGNYGDAVLSAAGAIPGSGKGIKAAANALPMDQASRMVRAREQGFRPDMPLYHGSDRSFTEFDPSQAGAMTGAEPARLGVWSALDPETAEEFAALAAKSRGGSPQVYPLLHRAEKPGAVDLDGTETGLEIAGAILDAFDSGHDAIMFRNFTTPSGRAGQNIIVVRNPEQVRSVFAKFDPKNINSRDLLATLVGSGAAVMVSADQAEAANTMTGPWERFQKQEPAQQGPWTRYQKQTG